MIWTELQSEAQLDQLQEESKTKSVLIFKHSRRCSGSRVALDRLERKWNQKETTHLKPYFLDLLANRGTSDRIADYFNVVHESPQVILIENGRSVYDRSHFEIDYDEILRASRS